MSRQHGGPRPRPLSDYPDIQIWRHGEDHPFWFSCYDSPNDGATSELFVTVKSSYVAVSNAALNSLLLVDSSKAIAVALQKMRYGQPRSTRFAATNTLSRHAGTHRDPLSTRFR